MMKVEVKGQTCADCKHFGGIGVDDGFGSMPVIAIDCRYEPAAEKES